MSYDEVVQAIADASKDADTLEQVVNGEAETQVKSRLGRMIYTLSTISNRINNLTAQAQLEISNLQDAINTAAAAGAGAKGWTDTLITLFSGRSLRNKLSETVSVKDYGAVGDGTLHKLSEKYASLSDAKAVYPFVTSLDQSLDWAAIQYCVFNSPNVFIPKGRYVLSDVVKTKPAASPYYASSTSGKKIYGDGALTIITRGDNRPATRIFTTDGASTTQNSDIANSLESCFAVHSPFVDISDMTIQYSAIAIYMGQDYTQSLDDDQALSNPAASRFNRLQIRYCGTGILLLAVLGNHYSTFNNIHFFMNQIDVHLRSSYWWHQRGNGESNNNRNTFTNITSNRSIIGLWNECGDTNTIDRWHGEGIQPVFNKFAIPEKLPSAIAGGNCLFVFGKKTQLNHVSHCTTEEVKWSVCNDGYHNSYVNNNIQEDKVVFISKPLIWQGSYVIRQPGLLYTANNYDLTANESKAAGALYLGITDKENLPAPNGVRAITKDIWHTPVGNRGSYTKEYILEATDLQANTEQYITFWTEDTVGGNPWVNNRSCIFEIAAVARIDSGDNKSALYANCVVAAHLSPERSFNKFGLLKLDRFRTGVENWSNADPTTAMTFTYVRNEPNNPRLLQIGLKSPLAATGVVLFVKLKVAA